MKKIIECVPNFSEGRNKQTIEAISEAISKVQGCTLLDVDPGYSTNRTVYTFVGDPEAVVEAALASARVAKERIDMGRHRGEHPRFGAMDVCPFIPVANSTMEECIQISKEFARRAADELGVPFFLYEEAAERAYRKRLPDVRRGEYEALEKRLQEPDWAPDFGPAEFVPSWGATATGARMFLIAYNVNIIGSANQAHRIALDLREAGRGEGKPGKLKDVKGMGWFVDEYNMAQVSVNLNNYKVTPIHVLFEEVKEKAAELHLAVAGSEIIGIIPLESLLMAADYYIAKEGLFIYQEEHKVRLAIERLGLNSVAPFDPAKRIIEYIVAEPLNEPLAGLTVRCFIEEIAARTSAPGGGSASAVLAAVGTGLGSMVAKLTQGVRRFESKEKQMQAVIPTLHELTQSLIPMIDKDTAAFTEFMEGLKMPKGTKEERLARKEKMQAGLKTAIEVPLNTMRLGDRAWDAMLTTAIHGNPASKSDVQVGARSLETGIWGAYQNVLINMTDIEDDTFKNKILAEAEAIEKRSRRKCAHVLSILEKIH